MYIFEALLLGVVQGLTEFLPISSSAHLTLLPQLFKWKAELLHSLSFDVALHLGTLLAVVIYFWRDIWVISVRWVQGIINKKPFENGNAKIGWLIIIATVPVVIAALCFKEAIETIFRYPVWVSAMLIIFALLMWWADRMINQNRSMKAMAWKESLIIGLAQSLALMPGVSRSGITITAGIFMGFRREQAARFAFLLSIPTIIGATIFAIKDLWDMATNLSWVTMVVGSLASTIVGYACIAFLLSFLKKRSLWIFVIYRLVFGAVILMWYFMK